VFGTNATTRATISSDGNFFISSATTNTNSSKLVVNGTISQTVSGIQYLVVDQSDIGTAPNEIPLNQYLGSMAYQDGSAYYNTGMTTGFRNRIINGAMVIDQRNAGASFTASGAVDPYVLDRWKVWANGGSGSGASFTVQQSSTAPAGFSKSMLITQTGSATPTGIHYNLFGQYIEGQNVFDLGWGTSSAKSITLSFWIRSSLTGTFGGAISNEAQIRSYPFTYTINTANTWEQKTIIVPGDTTGTWLTTNAIGLKCFFDLGTGGTYTGPANAWLAGTYLGAAGTNNWVGTNGSTLYITGVQLESGNIATPFDVRPYGTELALCQRYFVAYGAPISNQYVHLGIGAMYTGTATNITVALPVPMRSTPTISKIVSSALGNVWLHVYVGSTGSYSNSTPQMGETLSVGSNALRLYCPDSYSGGTAGQAAWCAIPNGAQLQLSAELT
jgi:hypothetical protein